MDPNREFAAIESLESGSNPARSPWRFSLKALLLTFALVAAFLGGRASDAHWSAPQAGTWQLLMPAGFEQPVPMYALGDNRFVLRSYGNLGGTYRWNGRRLVVESPEDSRFMGLEWVWEGDDLVLVAEPAGRPAGPSYLGARLRFVSADSSEADTVRRATAANPRPTPPAGLSQLGRAPTGIAKLPGLVADPWKAPTVGKWKLTVRPGPKPLVINLVAEGEGLFNLQGAGAMAGHYAVKGNRLVATSPNDRRMAGLAWAWNGNELVLVAEPTPPPTGASYLGAKLRYLQPPEDEN